VGTVEEQHVVRESGRVAVVGDGKKKKEKLEPTIFFNQWHWFTP
jgi:hypothetical protein